MSTRGGEAGNQQTNGSASPLGRSLRIRIPQRTPEAPRETEISPEPLAYPEVERVEERAASPLEEAQVARAIGTPENSTVTENSTLTENSTVVKTSSGRWQTSAGHTILAQVHAGVPAMAQKPSAAVGSSPSSSPGAGPGREIEPLPRNAVWPAKLGSLAKKNHLDYTLASPAGMGLSQSKLDSPPMVAKCVQSSKRGDVEEVQEGGMKGAGKRLQVRFEFSVRVG